MGKIIGICNQKGGTGKTTTAINLSAFLALGNQKTLLVDMDPQGNATSGVGVNPEDKVTIYEALFEEVVPSEAIFPTPWENLSVITSTISLTGAEIELVNLSEREIRLKNALQRIKEDFDYIVIDAPPSLGLLTVNVLAAADSLVIPIQCEYFALEGVSRLLNTIELIRDRLNPALEIEGVLLTMADFRTRLTLQVIEEVRKYFQDKTFKTIIPRNVKLAEAPSFGQPISGYDLFCVGSKAYLNLAQEILNMTIDLSAAAIGNQMKKGE